MSCHAARKPFAGSAAATCKLHLAALRKPVRGKGKATSSAASLGRLGKQSSVTMNLDPTNYGLSRDQETRSCLIGVLTIWDHTILGISNKGVLYRASSLQPL